jgi:collagenase-like PrtC family protease
MAIIYTQTDLDNLKEALLTGADEVRIGDRHLRYRNQGELIKLIQVVQAAVDGIKKLDTSPNLIQATFKKGDS